MTLEVVGAVCIAIAVIGGGLQLGGAVHVPHLSKAKLVTLAVVGVLFIATGIAQQAIISPDATGTGQSQTE